MTKNTIKSETEKVTAIILKIDRPHRMMIERIRKLILEIDPSIGEKVKWNSPSFFYTGEMKDFDPKEYKRDIVVVNFHSGKILLIFPTGARIKDKSGVLEGDYEDGRRLITIQTMQDIDEKEESLKAVINQWLQQVE